MHDANHDSFSTHRWLNRLLSYTSDALGASSWLWRFQHNTLHHGNANVVGFDADIALSPFARLAPSQPWHRWYRAQHVYIWPLYGFLALKNLLVSDVARSSPGRLDQQPIRQPRATQRRRPDPRRQARPPRMGGGDPVAVQPVVGRLAFYLACSWLVGFLLAVTFQLAHCVDITTMHDVDGAPPRRRLRRPPARHHRRHRHPDPGHRASRSMAGRRPRSPDRAPPRAPAAAHHLSPLAERFRQACDDNGVTYLLHPGMWSALRSHTRWLRAG